MSLLQIVRWLFIRLIRNHIKDYFAKYKLDEITPTIIETWLVFMSEKGTMRIETKKRKKKKFAVSENNEITVKPKNY